jgi:hypothetical protein
LDYSRLCIIQIRIAASEVSSNRYGSADPALLSKLKS